MVACEVAILHPQTLAREQAQAAAVAEPGHQQMWAVLVRQHVASLGAGEGGRQAPGRVGRLHGPRHRDTPAEMKSCCSTNTRFHQTPLCGPMIVLILEPRFGTTVASIYWCGGRLNANRWAAMTCRYQIEFCLLRMLLPFGLQNRTCLPLDDIDHLCYT